VAGRVVGILTADGVDITGVDTLARAIASAGAVPVVIAPHGGTISGSGGSLDVDKSAMTTQSVEYDALVVAGGAGAAELMSDPYTALNLGEAFRHYKPIAAWGEGQDVLDACGIPVDAPGVVTHASANRAFAKRFLEAVSLHRHWDRTPA
jgi:catalase